MLTHSTSLLQKQEEKDRREKREGKKEAKVEYKKVKKTQGKKTQGKKTQGEKKRKTGPKTGTVSMQIATAVAAMSLHNTKLVSRQTIRKYIMIESRKEVNRKLMSRLLSGMVERGYLRQVRMSYRLGPNACNKLKAIAGQ